MENNIEHVKDGSVYVSDSHEHISVSVHRVVVLKTGRWKKIKYGDKEYQVKTIHVRTENGSWFQLNLFKGA